MMPGNFSDMRGPSMFETLGSPIHGADESSAAALAAAKKAAGPQQKVELVSVTVRTYDLGDTEQRASYEADMRTLLLGTTQRTHSVLAKEPLKYTEAGTGVPRYIAHLQWAEFKLTEIKLDTTPVGGAATSQENQNDSNT